MAPPAVVVVLVSSVVVVVSLGSLVLLVEAVEVFCVLVFVLDVLDDASMLVIRAVSESVESEVEYSLSNVARSLVVLDDVVSVLVSVVLLVVLSVVVVLLVASTPGVVPP